MCLDSGAGDHACPGGFGDAQATCWPAGRPALIDIQGNRLPDHGSRPVMMATSTTGGSDIGAEIMFRVAEGLTKPVISAGNMLRDGGIVHLEHGKSFMSPPGLPMKCVPLELRNNSVYLRPRVAHRASGHPAPHPGPEGSAQHP